MTSRAPWNDPDWLAATVAELRCAVETAGYELSGSVEGHKSWARSCVLTVPTTSGTLWAKFGYGLPPGEHRVVAELAARHPSAVPGLFAVLDNGFVMEALPGPELTADDGEDIWCQCARVLGEVSAAERAHVELWRVLGVRVRTPETFAGQVGDLLESDVLAALDDDVMAEVRERAPSWIARFEDAFEGAPTLVHQDGGCCNISVGPDGPVLYDWSDVVVGSPVFACDRMLDQAPVAYHDRVIAAFSEPLSIRRAAFDAMRRSNVLHEVLRYHDELAWIDPDDDVYRSLSRSVCSQLTALVAWERRRATH